MGGKRVIRSSPARGAEPAARMDARERREQILSCAMRLFEERGYSQVSTSQIAEAAGVGRPLIHHYFGTKRELYLAVVQRLSYVPSVAVTAIPQGTLEQRVAASIDRWLDVAWRHRNMWLSTITTDGPGNDPEIRAILAQADGVAADRMIQALALEDVAAADSRLKSMILAYGGLAKAASRQWLIDGELDREDMRMLLSQTLLTVVRDVIGVNDNA